MVRVEDGYTEKQESAINTKDRTILVSAGAGAGKTRTLTARIIDTLLDTERPTDITSLCIVTFTNAAVGELREKIEHALGERIEAAHREKTALIDSKKNDAATLDAIAAAERTQSVLGKQLLLLPGACIYTIDAFCNKIVQENAEAVGLPDGYRIADSAEAALLMRSEMEALLERAYRGELAPHPDAASFVDLCGCLFPARDQTKCAKALCELYAAFGSTEDGIRTLRALGEQYRYEEGENIPECDRFVAFFREKFLGLCEQAHEVFSRLYDVAARYREPFFDIIDGRAALTEDEKEHRTLAKGKNSYGDVLSALEIDRARARALGELRTYAQIRAALSEGRPFENVPNPLSDPVIAHLRDTVDGMNKKFVKEPSSLQNTYFSYTEEELSELYTKLYKNTTILADFLEKFDDCFTKKKRSLGICEYSDIERCACECLWDADGTPSGVARSLREKYAAVYIDEYQDVSPLQDRIFRAVAREDNRFMVGDIKQAIYGFRSADPGIFARMKSEFSPLSPADGQKDACLIMAENFRCDRAVVDYTNAFFDPLFTLLRSTIAYDSSEQLVFAKNRKSGADPHGFDGTEPTFFLIEGGKLPMDADEATSGTERLSEAEAETVADEIDRLLHTGRRDDGSPIRPKDIALLFRTLKGHTAPYRAALKRRGIPFCEAEKKDLFDHSEISLMLCLLNALDNPGRDASFAGLLLSPLSGLDADALLRIRREDRSAPSLYEAFCAYVPAHPEDVKAARFFETLCRLRLLAANLSVSDLITRLLDDTILLPLASGAGGTERLLLLCDFAKRYEGGGHRSIYGFIHFVNEVIRQKKQIETSVQDEGDGVLLSSIHHSKGLEYPVVFLVDGGRKFRRDPNEYNVSYTEKFGFAMKLSDPSGLCLVENPVVRAINARAEEKNREETARVLYVGFTRAMERLYISAACVKPETEETDPRALPFLRQASEALFPPSMYSLYASSSVLDFYRMFGLTDRAVRIDAAQICPRAPRTEAAEDTPADGSALAQAYAFSYPSSVLTRLPSKISFSSLSPSLLDHLDEPETAPSFFDTDRDKKEDAAVPLPRFLTPDAGAQSRERGIATHRFLQFCDFAHLRDAGTEAEMERLIREKYLYPEDRTLVRVEEIDRFAASELCDRLLRARQVYREFRFHTLLPASTFTTDPDVGAALSDRELLLQGVMDCVLFEEDGTVSLVDYKTDRLSGAELRDPALAASVLRAAHGRQLRYYRAAAERIFGQSVSRVEIYSLALGACVDVSEETKS